jgi:hypothetical protein
MNFADHEEIAERQRSRGKKRRNDILWNSLTAVFIIASVAAVGYFLVIYSNPASAMNPYPPPTMPALIQIPTTTLTPLPVPATSTPAATATQMAVTTEMTVMPTEQATATTAPVSGNFLFSLKGNPVGMTNTTFHPSLGCNWQGVAGKVTDIQGKGIANVNIFLKGTYNGKSIDTQTLSGGAAQWIGEGGYEFVLETENAPVTSTGQLTIQLGDSSGIPLSAAVTFDTYAECNKNLTLINFQQSH